eukprot:CAMPEP_0175977404 /NCGR_PEP_ID=MMETSP0108-20121206/45058_1 /TAXON_ID=195067 ORGANISM="Goniomonas pacifica, Strain CCMP1869" /NCGR_SAMPLE_ID=MMETSP0108 /ASSEMBLY_ACC=CAM_ASM_000204 /LENGTH=54 /DNA_ID=CAMNT_0017307413 /DNA_START=100 /DNA_END=261 /DNA_ORIENTATION=-
MIIHLSHPRHGASCSQQPLYRHSGTRNILKRRLVGRGPAVVPPKQLPVAWPNAR